MGIGWPQPAAGGSSSDGRTVINKSFEITLAQLQAIGSTQHTFDLWTMDPSEGILWCWMENSGAAFSGGSVSGVYVMVGKAADPQSLYIQRELTDAGKCEDDNSNHGGALVAYAEMGDAGGPNDATTYYGQSLDIVAQVNSTGADMSDLTAGGPIYVHFILIRVDDTQLVAATP